MTDQAGRSPVEATITIGVDGRVYWHDVTSELLAVMVEVCAEPSAMVRRQAARALLRNGDYERPCDECEDQQAARRPG